MQKYLRLISRINLKQISHKMSIANKQTNSTRLNMIRSKPFIVICGCTGTGKTKLSIELAEWLIKNNKKAEIINSDAMQLYKNLDIITNKATHEEMKQIPHHLIGYLDSTYIKSNVIDYRNKAVELIDNLLSENKIPILVGGTHYYIHSVLWDSLIDDEPKTFQISQLLEQTETNDEVLDIIKDSIKNSDDFGARLQDSKLETNKLYEHLNKLDFKSAQKLHPNDRRKIIRALQIYYTYGCGKSDILETKNQLEEAGSFHGPLRYKSVCIFAMKCSNTDILNKRLDDRVDQMISNGLLNELDLFKKEFNSKFPNTSFKEYSHDYEFGIFQSIGFKEFEDYFSSNDSEEKKKQLFNKGVSEMKLTTRRYAKYQIRWVNNRFIKSIIILKISNNDSRKLKFLIQGANKYAPPIHELDTVDLEKWSENIFNKAKTIFEYYLSDPDYNLKQIKNESDFDNNKINEFNKCDICDKVFVDKYQWECHLKGNKHKKRKESLKRKEFLQLADSLQTVKKLKENESK